MINVEKRGGILHVKAQTMGTSSQISHQKTSLICSLEEVTHQVSVTVLSFHAKLLRNSIFIVILVLVCLLSAACATLI